jgi:23S rRNA pseudouridine1911/1915/1917 synthase
LKGKAVADPNHKTKDGDLYELVLPPPVQAAPKAEKIPLEIVYEDAELLVLNKPAGVVVHPGAGNWDHTLVNALLAHCKGSLSGIGGVERPGIVHRLDKDTSGLLVVAKNDRAHQALSAQFADRSLSRVYQALVWGVPAPAQGDIAGAIGRHPRARKKMAVLNHGGKEALTHYKVEKAYGGIASLVSCKLATGRTHQIRVHMEHKGHPVVGDPVYGSRRRAGKGEKTLVAQLEAFPRQALHAGEIAFFHPKTHKLMKFKAKTPKDMGALLRKLEKTI